MHRTRIIYAAMDRELDVMAAVRHRGAGQGVRERRYRPHRRINMNPVHDASQMHRGLGVVLSDHSMKLREITPQCSHYG